MIRQNLTIHDLPRIERPREKLIKYGANRLSNIELLAIILRTGKKGESVLALANRFLRKINLEKIAEFSYGEFRKISGIGPAKACELLSCVELGRRIFENKKVNISQLLTPQDVFDNLKDIRVSKKEHFVVFFLIPVIRRSSARLSPLARLMPAWSIRGRSLSRQLNIWRSRLSWRITILPEPLNLRKKT